MTAYKIRPMQQAVDKSLRIKCLVGKGTNCGSLYKEVRVPDIEERSDRLRMRALLK